MGLQASDTSSRTDAAEPPDHTLEDRLGRYWLAVMGSAVADRLMVEGILQKTFVRC